MAVNYDNLQWDSVKVLKFCVSNSSFFEKSAFLFYVFPSSKRFTLKLWN